MRYDHSEIAESKVSINNEAYMAESSQHTAFTEEGRRSGSQ